MSGLIQAMAILKATFDTYAGKGKRTLTKNELVELLRKEFPASSATTDKAEMDKFFTTLDNNKDGVIDFKEYVTYVAALSVICAQK